MVSLPGLGHRPQSLNNELAAKFSSILVETREGRQVLLTISVSAFHQAKLCLKANQSWEDLHFVFVILSSHDNATAGVWPILAVLSF
jgi:hypothetical protein